MLDNRKASIARAAEQRGPQQTERHDPQPLDQCPDARRRRHLQLHRRRGRRPPEPIQPHNPDNGEGDSHVNADHKIPNYQ